MSRLFLVLFVALAIFFSSSYGQQCGSNEEFVTCGSNCEPSCLKPRISGCSYDCKIGCQCVRGFLRDLNGRCVLPQHC